MGVEKRRKTTAVEGKVQTEDTRMAQGGYTSPDVSAAQGGQEVDFSMHVYDDETPTTDA